MGYILRSTHRIYCTILLGLLSQTCFSQLIYVNAGKDIFSFDPLTCEYTLIVETSHGFLDIAFDRNGTLYGCGNALERINTVTGGLTTLVELQGAPNGMTISADDIVYLGTANGELISYNLNTADSIHHGNVGFGCAGDFTFYKGELYMAAFDNQFVKVNIAHPEQSELLLTHQSQEEIVGIVSEYVNCNETNVYALSGYNSEIYLIDFVSLTLDLVCQLPIHISGGASTSEFLSSNPVKLGIAEVDQTGCAGETGIISFPDASGNGTLSFRLDYGPWQTDAFFDSLSSGTYTIELMDQQGCSDTIIVELPAISSITIYNMVVTPAECKQAVGQFSFFASGGTGELLFSLDGISFQSETLFTELPGGSHILYTMDEGGCIITTSFLVPENGFDIDLAYVVQNEDCNKSNGQIILYPNPDDEFAFALNDGLFQNELLFNHLEAGIYRLFIQNNDGCLDSMTISLDANPSPELQLLNITPASCSLNNGMIEVQAHGGNPPFSFKIDNQPLQAETIFDMLAANQYSIYVTDYRGCMDSIVTVIPLISGPVIQSLDVLPSDCYANTGEIHIVWHSTQGSDSLQVFNVENQLVDDVMALQAGSYRIVLKDASGCTLDSTILLPSLDCAFDIPNIFSPNGDGINDVFVISSHPISSNQLISCSIYDRWGNLVFLSPPIIDSVGEFRWDGKRLGKECAPGVYAFILRTVSSDESQKNTLGNITLIR